MFNNRAKGALYGLYVGDALGAPLEFQRTDNMPELRKYSAGGVHNVNIGEFTDDSSMALALMHSLYEVGFDLKDQMDKYTNWLIKGEYSSKGHCFDIGITTRNAITKYKITKNPVAGGTEHYNSGNGSLMRYAPVPLFFFNNGLDEMIKYGMKSSVTTHGSEMVLETIRMFTLIFKNILDGELDKTKILKNLDLDKYDISNKELLKIYNNDYTKVLRKDLKPTGYVVDSLNCALWAFVSTDNFEEAVIKAVNLGGDSDTIGAITGQIAGAYYGFHNIPHHFIDNLAKKDLLALHTDKFLATLN